MSFDFISQEQQILARLAEIATAAGIPVQPDAEVVDLTNDGALPVGAQIAFLDFFPDQQVGGASRHFALWAFDTYIDSDRASAAQKIAVSNLFSQALGSLIGWDIENGRTVRAEKVQRCGEQGRIRRRSFGFIIPAYVAG